MRKRVMHEDPQFYSPIDVPDSDWMDLESISEVELTSEEAECSIESALKSEKGNGWRAAKSGKQTIRFLFDNLQRIKRIHLLFEENDRERTQEFLLSWYDTNNIHREIVRQQFNFSPPNTTQE